MFGSLFSGMSGSSAASPDKFTISLGAIEYTASYNNSNNYIASFLVWPGSVGNGNPFTTGSTPPYSWYTGGVVPDSRIALTVYAAGTYFIRIEGLQINAFGSGSSHTTVDTGVFVALNLDNSANASDFLAWQVGGTADGGGSLQFNYHETINLTYSIAMTEGNHNIGFDVVCFADGIATLPAEGGALAQIYATGGNMTFSTINYWGDPVIAF